MKKLGKRYFHFMKNDVLFYLYLKSISAKESANQHRCIFPLVITGVIPMQAFHLVRALHFPPSIVRRYRCRNTINVAYRRKKLAVVWLWAISTKGHEVSFIKEVLSYRTLLKAEIKMRNLGPTTSKQKVNIDNGDWEFRLVYIDGA